MRVVGNQVRSVGVVLGGAVLVGLSLGGSAQRVTPGSGAAMMTMMMSGSGAPGGHPSQGYLGVNLRDVPEEMPAGAAKGALNALHGAEIVSVDHDGPAGKAGLHERDVVLQMNGVAIEGGEPLRRMLRETSPGMTVTFVILRGGQQQTVSAQMANREDVERQAWEQRFTVPEPATTELPAPSAVERRGSGFFSSSSRASRNFLGGMVLSPGYTGAMLETMAPQLAEYFGAQGRSGLLVRSVDANSPAATAGMHAGDVVVRVNTTQIASSGDWLRAVRENKGRTISVVVLRDKREQTLTMVPNARHHSGLIPERWHRSASMRAVPVSVAEPCGTASGTLSMI